PRVLASFIAGTSSSALAARTTNSSFPCARAASSRAWRCRNVATLESTSAAIRGALGTASIKMSCRLPSRSVDIKLIPVMLPPGRKRGRKPGRNHVLGNDHNRNCPSRVLEGTRDNIASGDDHIGCGLDQHRHQVGDPLVAGLKTSWNNRKILVFYEPV